MYKINEVMRIQDHRLITVPRFEEIPFLYHGFGTSHWKKSHFRKKEEWKDFRLVYLQQIHSDIIHFMDKIPSHNLKGDGMITRLPSLFLIIQSADCLPVLMVEEEKKIIAAVHCGWKGTLNRVIEKPVRILEDGCRCFPSSLLVALGPGIGQECYQVGEDIRQKFEQKGFSSQLFSPCPQRKGKYLFDLRQANVLQLMSLGVKRKNIHSVDICTHCHPGFPSFRRDREKAGRMLSFIGMAE
ncbi:MAG: peptidoglycan editing factor PgeF [Candidatus Aminicenantes bacterium]